MAPVFTPNPRAPPDLGFGFYPAPAPHSVCQDSRELCLLTALSSLPAAVPLSHPDCVPGPATLWSSLLCGSSVGGHDIFSLSWNLLSLLKPPGAVCCFGPCASLQPCWPSLHGLPLDLSKLSDIATLSDPRRVLGGVFHSLPTDHPVRRAVDLSLCLYDLNPLHGSKSSLADSCACVCGRCSKHSLGQGRLLHVRLCGLHTDAEPTAEGAPIALLEKDHY